jgi:hypothetical protein
MDYFMKVCIVVPKRMQCNALAALSKANYNSLEEWGAHLEQLFKKNNKYFINMRTYCNGYNSEMGDYTFQVSFWGSQSMMFPLLWVPELRNHKNIIYDYMSHGFLNPNYATSLYSNDWPAYMRPADSELRDGCSLIEPMSPS